MSGARVTALSAGLTLLLLETPLRLHPLPTGNDALWDALSSRTPPPQYVEASADPVLVYETRKGLVVNGRRITESHGILRKSEASPKKKPGVFRIAVLGDSVAANVTFRRGSDFVHFPDELERLLRRGGARVEVLNFAADGYGTREEELVLRERALAFSPDLLLLQYCYNDPVVSIAPYAYFKKRPRSASALLDFAASRLADTYFGDLLGIESRLFAADMGPVLGDPAAVRHWKRLYDPRGPLWRRIAEGFRAIKRDAGDIPVVVAVFPLLYDAGTDKALLDTMRAMVENQARLDGFAVVDLEGAFRRAGLINARKPNWDIYHPDDDGQRLAARELARALARLVSSRKGRRS